jgi:hypothetical protein
VNFLFLNRRRRLARAWVTIPALALLFAGAGVSLAYHQQGRYAVLQQANIILQPAGGGPAVVRTYVGLFSPARTAYDLSLAGDALASPLWDTTSRWGGVPQTLGDLVAVQAGHGAVRGLPINQWSIGTFRAEGVLPAGTVSVNADVHF